MRPGFGWTLLSREALRRANAQLQEGTEGVRDEIGFLAVHQAYADRFFPGTSVLQTRLRYALFIPWIYLQAANRPDRRRFAAIVEELELDLIRRLLLSGETGIIGGRIYPNPPVQSVSSTYWSALKTWGLLRRDRSVGFPSRQVVHRSFAHKKATGGFQDDDGQLLQEDEPIFKDLPEPPHSFGDRQAKLDFKLTRKEADFLRKQFMGVGKNGSTGSQSLLGRLAEYSPEMAEDFDLFSSGMHKIADQEDRHSLGLAEKASALVAIGRAIYSALVEHLREEDEISTDATHRIVLEKNISEFREKALELDLGALAEDARTIPKKLLDLMQSIQQWLRNGAKSILDLERDFAEAEERRKGRRRARLPRTGFGEENRRLWDPNSPEAGPVNYRWNNVRRLLFDLQVTK
jgi:hypothetical protein